MAVNAEHMSKFAPLPSPVMVSDKFSSGTINPKQTNKQTNKQTSNEAQYISLGIPPVTDCKVQSPKPTYCYYQYSIHQNTT